MTLTRCFVFLFIAIAVFISYSPTLFFPPRADQVTYLAEIASKTHPLDLIVASYDLNRTRLFAPGDELLFRPLLYVILGTEQVLFGHNFWAWQLAGIFAHLFLLWVLLRLLWRLSGPWLAFAGTWLFGLSITNYELVSWPHLTAYIVMMVFIVLTIEQLIFSVEGGKLSWDQVRLMILYLLFACFIYETANLFALAMAVLLFFIFPKDRSLSVWILTPVLLYAFFSYYNWAFVNHLSMLTKSHGVSMGSYLGSIVSVSSWWFYEGLFNGIYGYIMDMRTMFRPEEVMVFKHLVFNNPQIVLELILLFSYAGLAWINRREFHKKIKIIAVLMAMLFCYIAVIVIGRHDQMGALRQAIRINSYYLYFFWLIISLMAFVLMWTKENESKISRFFIIIFVAASLLSGLQQGKIVYLISSGYSQLMNKAVLLVTTLDLLVKEKGAEADFSFYVHPLYPGNSTYKEVHKKDDPPGRVYTFAELIYPQYYRPKDQAKYKLLVKGRP